MNKKKLIITITLLLLIIIGIFAFVTLLNHQQKIIFTIHDKEASELKKSVEYSDDIDYSLKSIHLKAMQNNKDISDQIKINKVKIDSLKTYRIKYTIQDQSFIYYMKVVDTSKPHIEGEQKIEIEQGQEFTSDMCKVSAIDEYDKDLSDKIKVEGTVDTNTPNTYTLQFIVEDSSHNKNTHTCTVVVTPKKIIPPKQADSITSNFTTVSNPNDIQVLINKSYRLPNGWQPSDLVSIGGNHSLRAEAANMLVQMKNAASAAGVGMNIVSTYRTQAYQLNLYHKYMASDPNNAPYYSAESRASEHELGLAIDISYDYLLHNDLQNSALGIWMAEHAHEYGWILRYPSNKTNITGYMFEPWHYRYVGVSLATHLRNNGITLEEY